MAQAFPSGTTSVGTVGRETSAPAGEPDAAFAQYLPEGGSTPEAVQGKNGAIYVVSGVYDGSDYIKLLGDSGGRAIVKLSDGTETLLINSDGSIDVRQQRTRGRVDDSETNNVGVGSAENYVITATSGTIWEIHHIGVSAGITSGTSGTHSLAFYVGDVFTRTAFAGGVSGDYNQTLSWRTSYTEISNSGGNAVYSPHAQPIFTIGDQQSQALIIRYSNNTNGLGDGDRQIDIQYTEVPE